MALQKAKYSDLPTDAVVLNEKQALKYYFNVMKNWENPSDVFFIKYGSFILGGASFFTGMFINNLFRMKLHLFNYGRMSTYLPTCCIPALFTTALHIELVVPALILMKDECPVCLEIRSSALQTVVGFGFPMIMSPISCLAVFWFCNCAFLAYGMLVTPKSTKQYCPCLLRDAATNQWLRGRHHTNIAHKYATYDIPYVTSKPLEVFKLVKKFVLPSKNLLFAIFVGQALLGSVITYLEARSVLTVNNELLNVEKYVELDND